MRFSYVKYDYVSVKQQADLRLTFEAVEPVMKNSKKVNVAIGACVELLRKLPDGRPRGFAIDSLAKATSIVDRIATPKNADMFLRYLEESYMWTGKAIRDAQILRAGVVAEQPERCNDSAPTPPVAPPVPEVPVAPPPPVEPPAPVEVPKAPTRVSSQLTENDHGETKHETVATPFNAPKVGKQGWKK